MWTDRKSVMMIGVKVNSKSELVEDREGKSVLYGRGGKPMARVPDMARRLIFAGTALETSYRTLVQLPSSRVTNSS